MVLGTKIYNNQIEQYNMLAWKIMVYIMEYQGAIKNKLKGVYLLMWDNVKNSIQI